MSDAVIVALISGAVALIAGPLLVIVKRVAELRDVGDQTHALVNSQLTAANVKVEVRDATIADLRVRLAMAAKLQTKTENLTIDPRH